MKSSFVFVFFLIMSLNAFSDVDFSKLNFTTLSWDGKKTSFKLAIKPGMQAFTQDSKTYKEYRAYNLSKVSGPFKLILLSYIRPAPHKRVFYPVVMLLDADKKVIHTSKPDEFSRCGMCSKGFSSHLEWTFTPDNSAKYLLITRDASFDGKGYSTAGNYFVHTTGGAMIPMPKKESTYFSRDGKLKLIVEAVK